MFVAAHIEEDPVAPFRAALASLKPGAMFQIRTVSPGALWRRLKILPLLPKT
jgi:hypothetical protein